MKRLLGQKHDSKIPVHKCSLDATHFVVRAQRKEACPLAQRHRSHQRACGIQLDTEALAFTNYKGCLGAPTAFFFFFFPVGTSWKFGKGSEFI